jgi:hypothetical protein
LLKRVEAQNKKSPVCPASSMRFVFTGLLGPDATSITYRTPAGQTKTEPTSGGVGAYLVVLKQTKANCADYRSTADSDDEGRCDSDATGSATLSGPTAITSVTYKDGKTCSLEPSASLLTAYDRFSAQERNAQHLSGKQARARFAKFLSAHHLTNHDWMQALAPQCPPVGWVAAEPEHITAADVATRLQVSVTEGKRFCSEGSWSKRSVQDNTVVCDHAVPKGYTPHWESSARSSGPVFALIRVSFIAREPVTTSGSYYEWNVQQPGNHGGEGSRTQANIKRGERVTFTMNEEIPGPNALGAVRGVYHGTISFLPNAGKTGPEDSGDDPGRDGSLIVGTFIFRLPPTG